MARPIVGVGFEALMLAWMIARVRRARCRSSASAPARAARCWRALAGGAAAEPAAVGRRRSRDRSTGWWTDGDDAPVRTTRRTPHPSRCWPRSGTCSTTRSTRSRTSAPASPTSTSSGSRRMRARRGFTPRSRRAQRSLDERFGTSGRSIVLVNNREHRHRGAVRDADQPASRAAGDRRVRSIPTTTS